MLVLTLSRHEEIIIKTKIGSAILQEVHSLVTELLSSMLIGPELLLQVCLEPNAL